MTRTGNPPAVDRMLIEHAAEDARLRPDAKDRRIAELEAEVESLKDFLDNLREDLRILTGADR